MDGTCTKESWKKMDMFIGSHDIIVKKKKPINPLPTNGGYHLVVSVTIKPLVGRELKKRWKPKGRHNCAYFEKPPL